MHRVVFEVAHEGLEVIEVRYQAGDDPPIVYTPATGFADAAIILRETAAQLHRAAILADDL